MSSPRRRGRRIPPKARGPRPIDRTGDTYGSAGEAPGRSSAAGDAPPLRPPASRAQNRAAKRAAAPRPKQVRRGGVGGRRGGPSNLPLIVLAIVALAIGAAVIAFGNPFGTPAASAGPSAAASAAASAAVYGDGTCPTSQPASLAAGDVRTVTVETELGNIVIRVDGARAPIATGNFVALVGCGYYDGVVFHRLVPGFVIQGGDPDGTGSGKGPGYSIADDPLNGTYRRGTVAMARSSAPNSQGSQFFIVLADEANAALTDPSVAYPYAILGEVADGMAVVDQIAAMPNGGAETGNKALQPIAMTKVTVTDGPPPSPSPAATSAAPAASSGIQRSPTPPPAQ